MSGGLGGSVGNQFVFQPQQFGMNPIDQRVSAPQDSSIDIGNPLDKLEAKNDLVKGYLSDFANLRGYAHHIKKKYDIDVTAPDFSDPNQQELHQTFMKALAKVKASGNALQRGRENEKMLFEQRAKNPDFYQAPQDTSAPSTLEGTGNIGLRTTVKEAGDSINRSFNTFGAYKEAREKKQALESHYMNLLQEAPDEETANQIAANLESIKSFTPNYSPVRATAADKKTAGAKKSAGDAMVYYQSLIDGDESQLNRLRASNKIDDAKFEWNGDEKVVKVYFKDKKLTPLEVSLDDPKRGLRSFGELLKEYSPEYKDIGASYLNPDSINTEARKNAPIENKLVRSAIDDSVGLFLESENEGTPYEKFEKASKISSAINPSSPVTVLDPLTNEPRKVISIEINSWPIGRSVGFDPKLKIKFEDGEDTGYKKIYDDEIVGLLTSIIKSDPSRFVEGFNDIQSVEDVNDAVDQALSKQDLSPEDIVRVKLPDGRVGRMPRKNVEKVGAEIVE